MNSVGIIIYYSREDVVFSVEYDSIARHLPILLF